MSTTKEQIVSIAAKLSTTRENDTIKFLTATGLIEGRVVNSFDESMPDNLKINALVLDVITEKVGIENMKESIVFLSDATLIIGAGRVRLGNIAVFTEEIIAFFL